jgi:hypothetical protein
VAEGRSRFHTIRRRDVPRSSPGDVVSLASRDILLRVYILSLTMIPSIAGLTGLALAAAGTALAQDACNGHVELCDRKYSDITFAAAHNAAFVGKGPSHNQFVYPEQDMDNGIRYLTTQVHIEDGEIRQCHSDCFLLDVGPFSEMVSSIKNWLDDHPREVVTLLVVNSDDNILIEEFVPAFEDAGAVDMVFHPGGNLALDEWPTLGELIDEGKRFIVFMGMFWTV